MGSDVLSIFGGRSGIGRLYRKECSMEVRRRQMSVLVRYLVAMDFNFWLNDRWVEL